MANAYSHIAIKFVTVSSARTQHTKSDATMRASFLARAYSSAVDVDCAPIDCMADFTVTKIAVYLKLF